jgi:Mg-chelatase subunit ChlD
MKSIAKVSVILLLGLYAGNVSAQNDFSNFSEVIVGYKVEQVRLARLYTGSEAAPVITEGDTTIRMTLTPPPLPRFSTIDEIFPLLPSVLPSYTEPKNICFVIDISSSMDEKIPDGRSRLDWVKEIFNILIYRFKPNDYMSVIVFDHYSIATDVIIEPRQIKSEDDYQQCIAKIAQLSSRGGTEIAAGLEAGYQQVEKEFNSNYINRVILLTDGKDESKKGADSILEIVDRYRYQGISTVSTIALTDDADKPLMTQIAEKGGGVPLFLEEPQPTAALDSELALLMTSNMKELQYELATEWSKLVWEVDARIIPDDGVTFKTTDRNHKKTGTGISYLPINLEKRSETIKIELDLDENVIASGNAVTLTLSSQSRNSKNNEFILSMEYQVSLNHPIIAKVNKNGTVTIMIEYNPLNERVSQ